MGRRSEKKNSVSVNFKGVESRVKLPEDDYRLKVSEVTQEEGDKGDYLKWVFEVADGKFEGQKVYYNTSLLPQALWNLRNLLMTLGVEVPDSELEIELDELPDLEMMGTIAHEVYEGKKTSRLVDFYPVEDNGEEGDKGDKDDKPARRGKKVEKLAKSDVEDMDRDGLEALISEHDLEVDPEDRKLRKDSALLEAVIGALEEKDLLEEEEKPARGKGKGKGEEEEKPSRRRGRDKDEEEEKPSRSRSGGKRGGKKELDKLPASEVEDMDEKELQGVIDTYELDVDLDSLSSMRKKTSAVLDALEDKGMLEE